MGESKQKGPCSFCVNLALSLLRDLHQRGLQRCLLPLMQQELAQEFPDEENHLEILSDTSSETGAHEALYLCTPTGERFKIVEMPD